MSSQLECCICMDNIVNSKTNCVTTECGHRFHTSCLMANVSHNGFGCPYCRQIMAEKPQDDDESETLSDYETVDSDVELYDDYALRGMRWMFQREEGTQIEENDNEEDDNEEDDNENNNQNNNNNNNNNTAEEQRNQLIRPNISFVAEKLAQRGTTYEDLIQAYLAIVDFEEYEGDILEEFMKKENTIFKKVKNIIREHTRQTQEITQNQNTLQT